MKFKKQIVTALLLAAMLSTSLVSCGGTEQPSSDVKTTTAQQNEIVETTTAETTESKITPDLPEFDGKGADIKILAKMEKNETGKWTARDIYVEEQNGEPMNDAIYERNKQIQEKYNCTIKQELMLMGNIYSNLTKVINAGDNLYDIVMPDCETAASLALDGMLYDLNDLEYIDLEKPWWSAQFTEDTNIGGKNYFANGDVCETFMRATYAVFFNKNSISDYSLENPYELVNNGTWTIDKMHEMSAKTAADIDGDGKITTADRLGLVMISNQIQALYTGSGEKLVKATDKGFEFTGDSERSLSALEKIHKLFTDYNVVLCVTDKTRRTAEQQSTDQVVVGETIFADGRALFLIGTMNNVTSMRDAENDFGILPLPKADEAQDDYYSYANLWAASCAAIPISVSDTDKSTIILEEMAYLSRELYTPAYYDVTLKTKSSRDEESLEMLDLIYERRTADLGSLYKVGNIMTGIQNLIYPSGQNTFASFMASNESAINAKLAELSDIVNK